MKGLMNNPSIQSDPPYESETWRYLTLYGMLERAARLWPDRPALVDPEQRISYRDLLHRVDRMAAGLLLAGVRPGDRVATFFGARIEWVVLSYAAAQLGALLVPLNIRFQPMELRDILRETSAAVLVTMDRYDRHDLISRVMIACPELEEAEKGRVESKDLPFLKLAVCFRPEGERYRNLMDFSSLASPAGNGGDVPEELIPPVRPEDPAAGILTSGTSGRPKVALLSHTNLIGHAHYLSRMLEIGPGDRYLNLLPFFHIAGYAQSVVMNHYAGSALVLPASFSPDDVIEAVERERVTTWAGMPVTIRRTLDDAARQGRDLSTIRKMHGASPELLDRVWRELELDIVTRMYGLTESAGLVSMIRVQRQDPGCVGLPLPGVDVRIVDPDSGAAMEPGAAGEIVFNGWNRFIGYLNQEQQDGSIDEDGYFHTGDRGFLDGGGCLHFLGRYKELIKTGGENVSQAEVERFILDNLPGIKAALVIGVPDETWGEAVTALIEVEEGSDLTAQAVHSVCCEGLASFKRPKHILWMPAGGWPESGTGKIDKTALREWACRRLNIGQAAGSGS